MQKTAKNKKTPRFSQGELKNDVSVCFFYFQFNYR